jgi:hypothetical protein
MLLLKTVREKARLPLVYASVAIVVAVLYIGSFLGPVKDILWPAAVGILIAFFIQSLQTIEKASVDTVQGGFTSAVEAVPELAEHVRHDKDVTDIRIIAATGWTTVRQVLPDICKASSARSIRITLNVIDNKGPFADVYPGHWAGEVDRTVERAHEQFAGPRFRLTMNAYSYLPAVHGILVNNEHLLLGFFGWDTSSGQPELTGAERPHRLYRRSDASSVQLFEVFDAWFEHGPQHRLTTSGAPIAPNAEPEP